MSLESSGQQRRVLDDPVAIRALAHPVRLELLSIVGRATRITTADAARALGISHGLTSHHLRQLAKYGFVEQVGGKDNRERPWRATSTSHSWTDVGRDGESGAAIRLLEEVYAQRAVSRFVTWQQQRAEWPGEWREHTGIGQSTIYLTVDELAEMEQAIDAVIRRYVEARPIGDVSNRPEGSVPIDVTYFVVPLAGPETEPGAGFAAAPGDGDPAGSDGTDGTDSGAR